MIATHCVQNLREIQCLLESLSIDQYQYRLELLSGASIGQHVRHILEFYVCLNEETENSVLNYDKRRRNLKLETDRHFALQKIGELNTMLLSINCDKPLVLEGDFSCNEHGPVRMPTWLNRELTYCLEHSIHHQALIKVGLRELGIASKINQQFGVASSTLRFQKSGVTA